MKVSVADLETQWQKDVKGFPASDDVKARVFVDSIERHGETHRRYHGVSHLRALFILLRQYAPDAALELHFAVWFHDSIYDPKAGDNEKRSADLAQRHLGELGAASEFIERVRMLILATVNHWQGPGLGDGDMFLDADIAILGAPPETYDQYAAAVREEYSFAPDVMYGFGRKRFLKKAMNCPPLFRTTVFEAEFGNAARANMRREYGRYGVLGLSGYRRAKG